MKKFDIEQLDKNLISLIHNEWAVLTVEGKEKVNGMTVNWVQTGWLWNKPVVTVYVRPQRYTYPLIENTDRFSLAFFDEKERDNLRYLGTVSGRDEDKLAHVGYTINRLDDTACIEQASLVLTLKKLAVTQIAADQFTDEQTRASSYPKEDYHKAYVCEITGAYIRD